MAQVFTKSAISVGKKACTLALGGLVLGTSLIGGASVANAAPMPGAFAGVNATKASEAGTVLPDMAEGEMLITRIDGTTATTVEGAEISLEGARAVTLGEVMAEDNPALLAEEAPEILIEHNPEWVEEHMPELPEQVEQAKLESMGGGGGGGGMGGQPAASSVRKSVELISTIGAEGYGFPAYFVMADGSIAWCVEPGVQDPSGTGVAEHHTSFNGYTAPNGFDFVGYERVPMTIDATTPKQMQQFNLLLRTNSDHNHKAMAFWILRSGDAGYATNMGQLRDHMSPGFNAAAQALANDVIARSANYHLTANAAQAYVDSQAKGIGSPGAVHISQPDANNIYHQKAVAKANANEWTNTVTLRGAKFRGAAPAGVTYDATKTKATIAKRTSDIALDVELTPLKNSPKMYQWSTASTWESSREFKADWLEGSVDSWYFGPGEQKTAFGPGPMGQVTAKPKGSDIDRDPETVPTGFEPGLTSKIVTTKGEVGVPLTLDTLELMTVDGKEWRRDYADTKDGSLKFDHRSVMIKANVYYHGKGKPKPTDKPYGDTYRKVATIAPFEVDGPGPVKGDLPAPLDEDGKHYVPDEGGFYVYQWIIDYKDQTAETKKLLPDGYYFADQYGDPNETPIIPPQVGIATELSESVVTLDQGYDENGKFVGYKISDKVALGSEDIGWLMVDNKRIPITVDVNFYGYKGDIVQQADVPADAVKLGSTQVEVAKPRTFVETPEVDVSFDQFREFDGITAVACINGESQVDAYKDMVFEECHDYGVPTETAPFVKPEIRTEAKTEGAVPGKIYDTAIVEKSGLPVGSTIGATAYKTPTVGDYKYTDEWVPVVGEDVPVLDDEGNPVMEDVAVLDEEGNPVLDEDGKPVTEQVAKVTKGEPQRWTQEEIDAIPAEALCEVQPVAKTERVPATEIGRYKLPDVTAKSGGEINWVEDTVIPGGEEGEELEWSRGKCGDVNEITVVEEPKITTDTQFKDVYPGNENWDNVHVSGVSDEENDEFELVSRVEGFFTNTYEGEAVCDVTDEKGNKIIDLSVAPIKGNATYESERYTVKEEWKGGRIDHVESLFLKNKETGDEVELAKGECGAATESTVVPDPKVSTKVKLETAKPGEKNHDNIIVENLPEIDPATGGESQYKYEATVKVFITEDPKAKAECKVPAQELGAVEVKGNGVTESEEYTIKEEWAGKRLDHVETLWAIDKEGKREAVHTGECGAVGESTIVPPKPVVPPVNTGTENGALIALVAGGVLLLGGGAAATAYAIRKKNAAK